MLHEDKDRSNCIHLATTEREFTQRSKYDIVYNPYYSEGSLHYLNVEESLLVTYRALHIIHPPQLYEGYKKSHRLTEIKISPITGEFVHSEEHNSLINYQAEQQHHEQNYRSQWPNKSHYISDHVSEISRNQIEQPKPTVAWEPKIQSLQTKQQQEEGTCLICGKKTRDWWYYNNADKTCKCRECLKKGLH